MPLRSRIARTAAALAVVLAAPVASALPASAASACSTTSNSKTCAYTDSRQATSWKVCYRDSIYNGLSYGITGNCQASTSVTVSHTVSVSVTASAKALIFASMEATLSADVSTSMSTGYVTSANFSIPAKTTVYCDRGIIKENVKGHTTTWWYSAGAGQSTTYWSSSAPARAQWKIYS
jgi:hypothetical protein